MKKFNDWFNTKCGWFFTNGRKAQHIIQTPIHEMDTVQIALANAY